MSIEIKMNNGKHDGGRLGFCQRCGNYSNALSCLGRCQICEKDAEKKVKTNLREKTYIKAGTREHLDL